MLAVIVYHLNHRWLPGGFSGVDVFFVISGFVVSAAQSRRIASSYSAFAKQFYARRIQRIVPALLVCLVTVSLASAIVIPGSWLAATNGQTALYAFVGLSNVILARTSDDYFSPRTEYNPFTHTWSLGVEEQFYVVFPLLFFLWAARRNRRSQLVSTLAFGSLLVASIGAAVWLAAHNPTRAYYTILTRFWELALGVLLYQAIASRPDLFAKIGGFPKRTGLAASLLMLGVGFALARPEAFPYPWAFPPVLGSAGLLAMLHNGEGGWTRRLLSGRGIVFLGRISYSLYLWHWPVVVLLRWTVGLDSFSSYFVAALTTLILAVLSYRIVESPFRYSRLVRRQPQLAVIASGLLMILISWGFTYQVFRYQTRLSLSVTRASVWDYQGPDLSRGPCPLHVTERRLHGGEISSLVPECHAPEQRLRLIMIGDSHASRYVPVLQRFSVDTGTSVLIYNKLGCSYLSLIRPDRDWSTCRDFTRAATSEIQREARAGDVLFLPSLRLVRLGEQWANFPTEVAGTMSDAEATRLRAAAVAEAADRLRPLAARGVRIVFEAPKPIFRAPAFRCADWFTRLNPICKPGLEMNRGYLLEYRRPVMEAYSALGLEVPGLQIWDPFPALCPAEPCRAIVGGIPIFFDGDHVTSYGNTRLYGSFKTFMSALLRESPGDAGASVSSVARGEIRDPAPPSRLRQQKTAVAGEGIRD